MAMMLTLLQAAALCGAVCGTVFLAAWPAPSPSLPGGAAWAALVAGLWGALLLARKPARVRTVLVIGGGPLAHELIAEIQARPELRQRVVGLIDDRAGAPVPGCPRLGSLRDLTKVVREVAPDRVIVALASRRGSMPLKALLDLRLHGMVVEDGAEVYERLTGRIAIEALTPSSLIFCKDFRASRPDLTLAAALSVPAAALLLLLLAPLLVLIAVAIKLDSRGPVFFLHERVGRKGKLFKLVKFRTMRPATGAHSEWVRDNHARLTRTGRFLRRFRLDELPQLVNIVQGEMNFVGPRPHPLSNLDLFVMVMRNTPECGEPIPYYALRSMVKPGLTGWAQVRYQYANDLEEEIEKMRYDLFYIKHMSAWLDVRIIFETFRIVLGGRESALPGTRPVRPVMHAPPRPALPVLRLAVDEKRPIANLAPLPVEALAAAVPPGPIAIGQPIPQA